MSEELIEKLKKRNGLCKKRTVILSLRYDYYFKIAESYGKQLAENGIEPKEFFLVNHKANPKNNKIYISEEIDNLSAMIEYLEELEAEGQITL